jgi:hypothetical protein
MKRTTKKKRVTIIQKVEVPYMGHPGPASTISYHQRRAKVLEVLLFERIVRGMGQGA